MATTPEGRVKAAVKKLLAEHGEHVYYYWPVPSGYGASTLDCIGFAYGMGFAIETKAPGKSLTPRQKVVRASIDASGARTFVIDDPTGLGALRGFLAEAAMIYHAAARHAQGEREH